MLQQQGAAPSSSVPILDVNERKHMRLRAEKGNLAVVCSTLSITLPTDYLQ